MSYIDDAVNDHIANRDNPHNESPEDVGLRNIHNYPISDVAEAEQGRRHDRYLTPRHLKNVFNGYLKEHRLMDESNSVVDPRDSYFTELDFVNIPAPVGIA